MWKPLVAYVDCRLQAFIGLRRSPFTSLWGQMEGRGRWSRLHAFGGLRGSPFTSLWWQMELESFTRLWWHVVYKPFGGVRGSQCRSLWWHTWIVVCKPLVAYVDRLSQSFGGRWSRLQAFGCIRRLSCISLWWHTWIVVHKHLMADGVVYKPLVACVDRRSKAFGGRWSRLQGFGGIPGLSCISLSGHTWIVVYRPLVAYVDRRLQALGGLRVSPFTSLWFQMESFTSLWWLAWIAVCKPLVAGGVINKPLVAYVDRRVQDFWWRTWIVV